MPLQPRKTVAPPKTTDLSEGPIGPLLVRMTLSMIVGTLSIVVFNLTDTFFVGMLGTRELAALSFTFPVVLIVHSIAVGLGTGASAVISRAVGEGDNSRVARLTTDSLTLSIIIVAVTVVAGILTINPLFRLLGATPDILPLARQYMVIWYVGVVFVIVPMVGNGAIRAAGDMATPSFIMMISATMNVILDPILIFGFGPFPRLEVAGAAIATVISRAFSLVVALWILHTRKHMIAAHIPRFREVWDSWVEVIYISLPTAATRAIVPLATGIFTAILARYGAETVAAFGVSQRIEFLALTVTTSLAIVYGPYAGQNLGAGKIDRVKQGLTLGYRFSVLSGIALWGLLALGAPLAARVFTDNPVVIREIVRFLRIVPAGYGLYGVFLIAVSVMYVLHRPLEAAGLSLVQMFGLSVPLAAAGAWFFGVPGVFGAIGVSYLVSGFLARGLLRRMLNQFAEK